MEERLYRRKAGGLSFLMGGDGPALLLLHGVPGSALAWQRVASRLTTRYRVILPDLMGFGATPMPLDGYYLEEQAHAVRQLLAHLKVTELIVGGHDFGGPVALTLLRLYPELEVKGLILAAANVFTDTPIPTALQIARVPGLGPLFTWAMTGTALGTRMLYNQALVNKEEVPWGDFRRHLTGSAMSLTRHIFRRSLADLPGSYRAVQEMLPFIHAPSLVLWGDEDPFFPVEVAVAVRDALPDAVLKVYAYTGHFVPEERAIETAEDILARFEE